MKTLLLAFAVALVVAVSGCASFTSSTSSSASLASGLRPAQGAFASHVVGP